MPCRKTGLLYRHFEKHHAKILNQLVQNQLQSNIKEENAPATPIKNLEELEEESRALREHIGTGSKSGKKRCHICNTEREAKKIEKHVKYCLKYFQYVQKDNDENSDEYTCKICEKSGFDPIGRLYYHIETRHGRMFDNMKEKTPFVNEKKSKSTHRSSFPQAMVNVNNQLTKVNKQLTKKEEQTQIAQLKQTFTIFECEICKKSFKSKFALNGHMQMHTQKGSKNSVDKENYRVKHDDEKENPIKIRPSNSILKEKYTVPTGIELIPIPMKNNKNEGNFQDYYSPPISNVNKQLTKRKQTVYNNDQQIDNTEVEQPAAYDDEVLRECYFCTMCDEDDADEAFKSYKPGEIRNHIVSNHSFSVKMQRKEKFEIRCFLKTDIELQEFEDVGSDADETELHICTMCDKNEDEAFRSVSASAVRKHAVEIHSYSLKMQKKYKSTIRCIQIPLSKPYSIKKEI